MTVVLAGIVAKGLGAVLVIFAIGVLVGIVLTLGASIRLRKGRRR